MKKLMMMLCALSLMIGIASAGTYYMEVNGDGSLNTQDSISRYRIVNDYDNTDEYIGAWGWSGQSINDTFETDHSDVPTGATIVSVRASCKAKYEGTNSPSTPTIRVQIEYPISGGAVGYAGYKQCNLTTSAAFCTTDAVTENPTTEDPWTVSEVQGMKVYCGLTSTGYLNAALLYYGELIVVTE